MTLAGFLYFACQILMIGGGLMVFIVGLFFLFFGDVFEDPPGSEDGFL